MTYASLCFLSYERPEFLERAIVSAVHTAGEPVEVIVHDDGSTDPFVHRTLEALLVSGYVSTVIKNPPGHNQGQGVALNRMFHMASGDPIIKLDQDLIFKPEWLARTREILADDRVGLLGLFKYWHDPVDWRKTHIEELTEFFTHTFHTHICGSGMVIPRHVWERLGPFEEHYESFGEDWEFQKNVDGQLDIYNALPEEDLVTNQGFGIGPSTVVIAGPDGQPTVHKINKQPRLVGGNE